MSYERAQCVKRPAVQRATEIIAECPIDAVCMTKNEKTKKRRFCGHFGGSSKDLRGYLIFCNFAAGEKE